VIKNLLEKLAYLNLIISLGAVSIAYLVVSLLSFHSDFIMYLVCFLVSMFVYSFNRFTDIKEDMINNPERVKFFKKFKYYFFISSLISFLLVTFTTLLHSFLTFLVSVLPIVLVILYSKPWLPNKISFYSRLKEIFFIKNLVVSTGWSLIPFFVAVYTNSFHIGIFFISIFVFLRIFIGVIIFDVRDMKGDKIHNIFSIPLKLGLAKTKSIVHVLNLLSVIILFLGILYGLNMISTILVGLFAFFMGLLYIYVIGKDIDIKFFCNVIVDGEYVMLGAIPFILKLLG
jgi:4-hydroxybenzoate polyprenyltransferase